MRTILITAIAATVATAAGATTTTMHHRHVVKTDTGSAATKELNEKSLQQASAGATMTPPMATPAPGAMSDAGTPMTPPAPGAAPMPSHDPAMSGGDMAMPPAPPAPTTPQ